MRHRRVLVGFVMLLAVGCGPSSGPAATDDEPLSSPTAGASEPGPTTEPLPTLEVSFEPIDSPAPAPTDEPSDPPASESTAPVEAAACTGSDDNRVFFADAARTLTWTVYCASLPAGWFVGAGEYRRASGGWLEISYRGPGGARFELHEGAFCHDESGCIPSGPDAGEAAFGDRTGTLISADDGGWALVVGRGEPISWLAVGSGLSEDRFRDFTAALTTVAD